MTEIHVLHDERTQSCVAVRVNETRGRMINGINTSEQVTVIYVQNDVVLYERLSWTVTSYLSGGHDKPINCVSFSPNGAPFAIPEALQHDCMPVIMATPQETLIDLHISSVHTRRYAITWIVVSCCGATSVKVVLAAREVHCPVESPHYRQYMLLYTDFRHTEVCNLV
eukprot:scaffold80439_cov47-Prasinocladus_malaysianus.AAC.3